MVNKKQVLFMQGVCDHNSTKHFDGFKQNVAHVFS